MSKQASDKNRIKGFINLKCQLKGMIAGAFTRIIEVSERNADIEPVEAHGATNA